MIRLDLLPNLDLIYIWEYDPKKIKEANDFFDACVRGEVKVKEKS